MSEAATPTTLETINSVLLSVDNTVSLLGKTKAFFSSIVEALVGFGLTQTQAMACVAILLIAIVVILGKYAFKLLILIAGIILLLIVLNMFGLI